MYGKTIIKKRNILVSKNSNNFKFLTFIPARSGSVGIKNKNIIKIGKKRLLEFTFEFIKDLNLENNYIHLSTDSKKYQKIAIKNDIRCEFLRTKKISRSKSRIEDAIFEFLNHQKIIKHKFKYLILLLPTQPFRDKNLFRKGVNLLNKSNCVISLKSLDRSNEYIFNINKKKIFLKKKITSTNRNEIQKTYTPCGCFYMMKLNKFKKNKSLFINEMNYLVSSYPSNLDIDNQIDLKLARFFYQKRKNFKILK